jgi:hypothetical protein
MKRNPHQVDEAIREFNLAGTFNARTSNRITSTLQFLKHNSLSFTSNIQSGNDDVPTLWVDRIRTKLTERKVKNVIIYTDGSTNPRLQHPNSGSSVIITDPDHKVIYQGGMAIRTDGNNFLAELAAASCAIKALPPDMRPWLNFCRKDLLLKRTNLTIEHISSHKGNSSPEQKGNAKADEWANRMRKIGEEEEPYQYFTLSEEPFILKFKESLVQGDPRIFLKKLEEEKMIEIWKQKAPKQAEFITKHRIQIQKQAKRVWKWAVSANDGKAWIYYIYAACQWLPTNRRLYYNDKSPYGRQKCQLCLSGNNETMQHIWECPALAAEQTSLVQSINDSLIRLKVPFAQKQIPTVVDKCLNSILGKIRNNRMYKELAYLSAGKLRRLVSDYWRTNKISQFPFSLFISKVSALLPICQCIKGLGHVCGHKNIIALRDDLAEMLRLHFSLNVEANTSALGRSLLFGEWCSVNERDVSFGNKGAFWNADLVGKIVYL